MGRKIIIGLAILLFTSCDKQVVDDSAMDNIIFDVEVTETKALVTSDADLKQSGNELRIYDIHTKADGSTTEYLNNQKVRYDGSQWNFCNESNTVVNIPWTRQGYHHFFAYLSKYSDIEFIPEYSYDGSAEGQYLTIEEHTITRENQYDFLYAEAVRDVESQGTGTVTLKLKHLFAAVDFQVRNMTGYQMTINSFKINNMRVKGNAQIGFGVNPIFELETPTSNNGFDVSNKSIASSSNPVSLYNSFTMWPHRADYYKDLQASITYTLGTGTNSTNTAEFSLIATNPSVSSWDPGCRYVYTITISDIILIDVIKVVDWINDDVILQQ